MVEPGASEGRKWLKNYGGENDMNTRFGSLITGFAIAPIMIVGAVYFAVPPPGNAVAEGADASGKAGEPAPTTQETLSPEKKVQLELHLTRGYAALRDDDHEGARVEFVEATKLQPNIPQYWKQLAYIDLKLGDEEEATKSFEKAQALDPKDESIQEEIDQLVLAGPLSEGYDALCSQDYELARDAFTKAIELRPDRADLWVQLAFIEDQLGNAEAAMTAFGKALELDPVNATAKEALERVELKEDLAKGYEALERKDYAAARVIFGNAVERAPERADLWRQIGYIEENLGNDDSAKEAFARGEAVTSDEALEIREKVDALINDGYISLCEKDYEAARVSYEAAVKLDPERADLWRQLGYVETNLGNKPAAQTAFDKADLLSSN